MIEVINGQRFITPRSASIARKLWEFGPEGYPYGTLGKLAEEHGVSRQNIFNVATRLGLGQRPAQRYLCTCGKVMAKNMLCMECRIWIKLPCGGCGAPVRRRIKEIIHRLTGARDAKYIKGVEVNAKYAGNVYCNRKCFGSFVAREYGWGSELQRKRRERLSG
jgi:hypothetical protein